MLASVEVVPQSQYERAVAGLEKPQALGAQEWNGVCAKCHGFEGQGGYGPALRTNALITDKRGLTPVITKGRGRMPAVARGWSDAQIDALLAYLKQHVVQKGGATGGG
jgi:mono/diheme cytochrome c family protein